MKEERPARIRIEDFATPRFSPKMAQLRTSLADHLHLEVDALLADAAAQTGLDDFGAPDFTERLGVLLYGLREEAGLSPFGVVTSYSQLLQLVKNRLLIQNLLTQHPEVHEVRIHQPIIIVGLPRTGTTHLHNLMSANPGLRSLPYFKRMHEMTVEHAHEEIHLLAIVSTMMFETMAVMPTWLDYYRAHDQTPLSFTTSAPSASIPASAARRCGFTSTASA